MGLSNLRRVFHISEGYTSSKAICWMLCRGGVWGGGVSAVTSNTGDVDTIKHELGSIDTK